MRKTLMMSVAMLGLVGGAATAQSGSSPTPPNPAPASQMPMRHGARMRHDEMAARAAAAKDQPMDDQSAPPTSAYRGGVGSPYSTKATNLTPGRSEFGARLPDPEAAGGSPHDLLAAAQRALNQGKTGAAQEALERAETRVLSRTTDPGMANQPDQQSMVQNIAQARHSLGAGDVPGAKQAIAMAMEDRVPPRGPATTTMPAGAPPGTSF